MKIISPRGFKNIVFNHLSPNGNYSAPTNLSSRDSAVSNLSSNPSSNTLILKKLTKITMDKVGSLWLTNHKQSFLPKAENK